MTQNCSFGRAWTLVSRAVAPGDMLHTQLTPWYPTLLPCYIKGKRLCALALNIGTWILQILRDTRLSFCFGSRCVLDVFRQIPIPEQQHNSCQHSNTGSNSGGCCKWLSTLYVRDECIWSRRTRWNWFWVHGWLNKLLYVKGAAGQVLSVLWNNDSDIEG